MDRFKLLGVAERLMTLAETVEESGYFLTASGLRQAANDILLAMSVED